MRRTVVKTFTILWLFGMYLILFNTFIMAYNAPDKVVRVAINHQNEAELEMFMLLGGMFVALLGTAYIILDIKNDFILRMTKRLKQELS
jgi:hypothetical protein